MICTFHGFFSPLRINCRHVIISANEQISQLPLLNTVSQVFSSQRSADSKKNPTGPFGEMKGITGNSKFYKGVGEG